MNVPSFPSAAYLEDAGNVKEIKGANNNFGWIKNLLELQPTARRNEPSALIFIQMLITPLFGDFKWDLRVFPVWNARWSDARGQIVHVNFLFRLKISSIESRNIPFAIFFNIIRFFLVIMRVPSLVVLTLQLLRSGAIREKLLKSIRNIK